MFRRRRRRDEPGEVETTTAEETGQESGDTPVAEDEAGASAGAGLSADTSTDDVRADGPWDISEVPDPAEGGRVDLGGMWLPGREGMEVRVEVDEQTQQVAAVTVILGHGAVQMAPFAAPRREGLWSEVRTELASGIVQGGGMVDLQDGPFGTEVFARMPVQLPNGGTAAQPVRFVGVDGPRWFLRAAFSGQAAIERGAAEPLEEILRGVVVVRGDAPMAPREPIPLRLPDFVQEAAEVQDESRQPPNPFERGPEITEIR